MDKLPMGGYRDAGYDVNPSAYVDETAHVMEAGEFAKIAAYLWGKTYNTDGYDGLQKLDEALHNSKIKQSFCCPEMRKVKYVSPGNPSRLTQSGLPFVRSWGIGYVVIFGYNYLAGFTTEKWPALPQSWKNRGCKTWRSAKTLTDSGQSVVITDRTRYCPDGGPLGPTEPAFSIPHTPRGYYQEYGNNIAKPREVSGAGTNVGRLDGSVTWKPLSSTEPHQMDCKKVGGTYQFYQAEWTFW